ncbi:MAG: hypothetical protein ACRDN0_07570 [Trebonia sp.]
MPLDKPIKTMRETGADMKDKYQEPRAGVSPSTSRSAESSHFEIAARDFHH